MLIHNISVYSFPISLLKDIERSIRNFIWYGDIERKKRKMVKVAWHKVCKPLKEGDIGIKCLITLNEASNLKLCWDLKNSQEPWAILIRNRAFNNIGSSIFHLFSSSLVA